MSRNGLLIDYEYCTGCHSCEVSCKNEHNIPRGQWGIKMTEVGPFQITADKWEWNYVPVPTQLCNLCEHRTAKGDVPSCVLHCLGGCMEFGTVEELAKKDAGKREKSSPVCTITNMSGAIKQTVNPECFDEKGYQQMIS